MRQGSCRLVYSLQCLLFKFRHLTENQKNQAHLVEQRLFRGFAVANRNGKGHTRVLGAIALDFGRQEVGQERLTACDVDVSAADTGEIRNLRLKSVEVRDLVADMVDHQFAGRAKAHASWQALEELCA